MKKKKGKGSKRRPKSQVLRRTFMGPFQYSKQQLLFVPLFSSRDRSTSEVIEGWDKR